MKTKITILERIHEDGIALLKDFAKVEIAFGFERSEFLKTIIDSDVIVIKSVIQINKELLDQAPNLKIIARAGTGVDNIDLHEAKKRNIPVLTIPTGNTIAAAEFSISQMLMLCRHIPEAVKMVNQNDYRRHIIEGDEIQYMTVGLVGIGNVGMAITERLNAFRCKILAYDPNPKDLKRFQELGGELASSFEDLLSRVDILNFSARLNSENHHMLNENNIGLLKKGVYIINCARAALIDDQALLNALDNEQIAAAALDVLEPEPPFDHKPNEHNYKHILLNHSKVVVTPHLAASTIPAQRYIATELAKIIKEELNIN